MDDKLAKRIHEINEPSTIKMARLSRELREKGLDIINLSLGEPDFDTPEHIKEAAIEAIKGEWGHYPPVAGYADVREALAQKFRRDNNLPYSASNVMISTGAKQSLINVILALVDKGEEVVVPAPYWVTYPEMIKLAEAKCILINAGVENDYKITPGQLEAAITPKTKAFLFSSPGNPTGSVYSKEELDGLAQVFKRHPQVFIISDEIYEYINFTGGYDSLAQHPDLFERTIIINGLSKGYAMTGWRIGFTAGPEWIIKACEKLQGQFTSGANSIAQRAALAALNGDMKPTQNMCKAFHERRDLMINRLKEVEGIKYSVPEGAYYLFPDVSYFFGKTYNGTTVNDADDLTMYILEKARVSLVPGTGFGAKECIRISFAASKPDLEKACDRIIEALNKLN